MSSQIVVDIVGNLKLQGATGIISELEKMQQQGVNIPVNLGGAAQNLKSFITQGGTLGSAAGAGYTKAFMDELAKGYRGGLFKGKQGAAVRKAIMDFDKDYATVASRHGAKYWDYFQEAVQKKSMQGGEGMVALTDMQKAKRLWNNIKGLDVSRIGTGGPNGRVGAAPGSLYTQLGSLVGDEMFPVYSTRSLRRGITLAKDATAGFDKTVSGKGGVSAVKALEYYNNKRSTTDLAGYEERLLGGSLDQTQRLMLEDYGKQLAQFKQLQAKRQVMLKAIKDVFKGNIPESIDISGGKTYKENPLGKELFYRESGGELGYNKRVLSQLRKMSTIEGSSYVRKKTKEDIAVERIQAEAYKKAHQERMDRYVKPLKELPKRGTITPVTRDKVSAADIARTQGPKSRPQKNPNAGAGKPKGVAYNWGDYDLYTDWVIYGNSSGQFATRDGSGAFDFNDFFNAFAMASEKQKEANRQGRLEQARKRDAAAKAKEALRRRGDYSQYGKDYDAAYADEYLRSGSNALYEMLKSGKFYEYKGKTQNGAADRAFRNLSKLGDIIRGEGTFTSGRMSQAARDDLAELYRNVISKRKGYDDTWGNQVAEQILKESPGYISAPTTKGVKTGLGRTSDTYYRPRQMEYLEKNIQTGEMGRHKLDESGFRRVLNHMGVAEDPTSMMWLKADNLDKKGQRRLQQYINEGIVENGSLYTLAAMPANEERSGMVPFIRNDLAPKLKELTWGGLSVEKLNSIIKDSGKQQFSAPKVGNDVGSSLTGSTPVAMDKQFTVQEMNAKKQIKTASTSLIDSLIVLPEQEVASIATTWTNALNGRNIINKATRNAMKTIEQSITDGQTIASKEWAGEINKQMKQFNPNATDFTTGQFRGEMMKSNVTSIDWKKRLFDLVQQGVYNYEDMFVTDIYGQKHNLLSGNVQALTTEKSLRSAPAYRNIEEFRQNAKANNKLKLENTLWGVVNNESSSKQQRTWSMQMLQNRQTPLSVSELEYITGAHKGAFNEALKSPEGFFKFTGISSKSTFGQSLLANPDLLNTPTYLNMIASKAFTQGGKIGHFDRGMAGQLITDSPFARAVSDPFEAISMWLGKGVGMGYGKKNDKGAFENYSYSAIPQFKGFTTDAQGKQVPIYGAWEGGLARSTNEVYSPIAFERGATAGMDIATNRFPQNVASHNTLVDSLLLSEKGYGLKGTKNLVYLPGRNSSITGQNTDFDGDMMELVFGKQGKNHPLAKEVSNFMREVAKPSINKPAAMALTQGNAAKQVADAFGARLAIGNSANNLTRFLANNTLQDIPTGLQQITNFDGKSKEAQYLSLLAYSYAEIDKAKAGYGYNLPPEIKREIASGKYPMMQQALDMVKGHADRGSQYNYLDYDAEPANVLDQIVQSMRQAKENARNLLMERSVNRDTSRLVPHIGKQYGEAAFSGGSLLAKLGEAASYTTETLGDVSPKTRQEYMAAFEAIEKQYTRKRGTQNKERSPYAIAVENARGSGNKYKLDVAELNGGQTEGVKLDALPSLAESVLKAYYAGGASMSPESARARSVEFYNEVYKRLTTLKQLVGSAKGTMTTEELARKYETAKQIVETLPKMGMDSATRMRNAQAFQQSTPYSTITDELGKEHKGLSFLERSMRASKLKTYRLNYKLEPGRIVGFREKIGNGTQWGDWKQIDNVEQAERLAQQLITSQGRSGRTIARENNIDKFWMNDVKAEDAARLTNSVLLSRLGKLNTAGATDEQILSQLMGFNAGGTSGSYGTANGVPTAGALRKQWFTAQYKDENDIQHTINGIMENYYSQSRKARLVNVAGNYDRESGEYKRASGISREVGITMPEIVKEALVNANNLEIENIYKQLGPNATMQQYRAEYEKLASARRMQQDQFNKSRFSGQHLMDNLIIDSNMAPRMQGYKKLANMYTLLSSLQTSAFGEINGAYGQELRAERDKLQGAINMAYGYTEEKDGKQIKHKGYNQIASEIGKAMQVAPDEYSRAALEEYLTSKQIASKTMDETTKANMEKRIGQINTALENIKGGGKYKNGDYDEFHQLPEMTRLLAEFGIKFGSRQAQIASGLKPVLGRTAETSGSLMYGSMSDEELWGNMTEEQFRQYQNANAAERQRMKDQGLIAPNAKFMEVVDQVYKAGKLTTSGLLLDESNWQYMLDLINKRKQTGHLLDEYKGTTPQEEGRVGSSKAIDELLAAGSTKSERQTREKELKSGLYKMFENESKDVLPLQMRSVNNGVASWRDLGWAESAAVAEKQAQELIEGTDKELGVRGIEKQIEEEKQKGVAITKRAAEAAKAAQGKESDSAEVYTALSYANQMRTQRDKIQELEEEHQTRMAEVNRLQNYAKAAREKSQLTPEFSSILTDTENNAAGMLSTNKTKRGIINPRTATKEENASATIGTERKRLIDEVSSLQAQGLISTEAATQTKQLINTMSVNGDTQIEWQDETQRRAAENHRKKKAEREANASKRDEENERARRQEESDLQQKREQAEKERAEREAESLRQRDERLARQRQEDQERQRKAEEFQRQKKEEQQRRQLTPEEKAKQRADEERIKRQREEAQRQKEEAATKALETQREKEIENLNKQYDERTTKAEQQRQAQEKKRADAIKKRQDIRNKAESSFAKHRGELYYPDTGEYIDIPTPEGLTAKKNAREIREAYNNRIAKRKRQLSTQVDDKGKFSIESKFQGPDAEKRIRQNQFYDPVAREEYLERQEALRQQRINNPSTLTPRERILKQFNQKTLRKRTYRDLEADTPDRVGPSDATRQSVRERLEDMRARSEQTREEGRRRTEEARQQRAEKEEREQIRRDRVQRKLRESQERQERQRRRQERLAGEEQAYSAKRQAQLDRFRTAYSDVFGGMDYKTYTNLIEGVAKGKSGADVAQTAGEAYWTRALKAQENVRTLQKILRNHKSRVANRQRTYLSDMDAANLESKLNELSTTGGIPKRFADVFKLSNALERSLATTPEGIQELARKMAERDVQNRKTYLEQQRAQSQKGMSILDSAKLGANAFRNNAGMGSILAQATREGLRNQYIKRFNGNDITAISLGDAAEVRRLKELQATATSTTNKRYYGELLARAQSNEQYQRYEKLNNLATEISTLEGQLPGLIGRQKRNVQEAIDSKKAQAESLRQQSAIYGYQNGIGTNKTLVEMQSEFTRQFNAQYGRALKSTKAGELFADRGHQAASFLELYNRYRNGDTQYRLDKANATFKKNITDPYETRRNYNLSKIDAINRAKAKLDSDERYKSQAGQLEYLKKAAILSRELTKAQNELTMSEQRYGTTLGKFQQVKQNMQSQQGETYTRLQSLGMVAGATIAKYKGRQEVAMDFAKQQISSYVNNLVSSGSPYGQQYLQLKNGSTIWKGSNGTIKTTAYGEQAPIAKNGEQFTAIKNTRGIGSVRAGATVLGNYMNMSANKNMNNMYTGQMLWGQAVGYIQKFYTYTKALNDEMREYKKIQPDWDTQDMTQYVNDLGKVGLQYGKTTTEMANASQVLTRGGYGGSTDELKKINQGMTENSILMSNIADEELTVEDASNSIISAVKAWGIDDADASDFARHYVDAANEVSNNYAVKSNDITENLATIASASATNGMDINETIALLTGGAEMKFLTCLLIA